MNSETSSQATAPAKRQMIAQYLSNPSIFGAKPMVLEWTHDDRLRLFIIGDDGVTATEVLFDLPVHEVEKVTGTINMMYVYVAGKKYRVYTTDQVAIGVGAGGAAGLGYAGYASLKSGIKQWVKDFKQVGVKAKHYGYGFVVLMAFGIIIVLGGIIAALLATGLIES